MSSPIDFQAYLQSVREHYAQCQECFTYSDALELKVQIAVQKGQGESTNTEERELQKAEKFEVLEGLRNYVFRERVPHVLLKGRPGSGKTTALQRLLWEEAGRALNGGAPQTGFQIPVLVKLRLNDRILLLMQAAFRQHRLRLSEEQLEDLLWDGRLLLLLDGVNEIPSRELLASLEAFRLGHPTIPMVFTTRDLGVGGDLQIEQKLEMQPLTEPQMREFVQKYLEDRGDDLLRQLQGRLPELAETPLLLKMLCDVFQQNGRVPANKGELFRWFDREYERRKGTVPISEDCRRFRPELLQHLAFGMLAGEGLEPQLTLKRTEAEQRLEQLLSGRIDSPGARAKEWLEDLLEHHLLQVAADPKDVEFLHQLFQEYYAAEFLLERLTQLSDAKLKGEYLNYLKWTEPVALMLALVEDEAQALRVVELTLEVDWMLGARLAGEVKEEFQEKTVKMVDELSTTDWMKAELLERTRSNKAISFLKNIYNNCSGPVISDITMGELRNRVRQSLFLLGCSDVLEEWDRIRAEVESLMTENLAEESNHQEDINPYRKIIEEFLNSLKHKNREAYSSYLYSIDRVRFENSATFSFNSAVFELLNHPNKYTRWGAIHALGAIGSEEVVPGLLSFIENPNSLASDRSTAAEVIGRLKLKSAIPELIEFIKESPHPDVRISSVYALRIIASEEVIPGLELGIQDLDSEVRRHSIQALERVDSDKAAPVLMRAILNPDKMVYRIAADRLRVLSNKETIRTFLRKAAIPTLIQMLECSESWMTRHITFILWNVIDEEQFSILREKLSCEDSISEVDVCISLLLGKFGLKEAVPGLLVAIKNSDSEVRQLAAFALGQVREIEIAEHLPYLHSLISTYSGQEAFRVLTAIQNNCKFYNYDIWKSSMEEKTKESKISSIEGQPIIINGDVGNMNTGSTTIHGDQVGVKNSQS